MIKILVNMMRTSRSLFGALGSRVHFTIRFYEFARISVFDGSTEACLGESSGFQYALSVSIDMKAARFSQVSHHAEQYQ